MTPEIEIPREVTALIQQAPGYLARTRAITSAEDYLVANDELAKIKRLEKDIQAKHEELLEPTKTAFAKQKAQLDTMFKPYLDQLKQAKTTWDAAISGWRAEQKRLADEETRRRQEEVLKEQRRLREAAAAEQAKADKIAAEKRKRAEEEEAQGRAAAAARLREQALAKEQQAASRVSVLETTAATMSATPVEVNIPKSDSGHGRITWSGELAQKEEWTEAEKAFGCETSFEGLVLAIGVGIQNKTYFPSPALLKLDGAALNKQAASVSKGNVSNFRMPFCRARSKETTVSSREKKP